MRANSVLENTGGSLKSYGRRELIDLSDELNRIHDLVHVFQAASAALKAGELGTLANVVSERMRAIRCNVDALRETEFASNRPAASSDRVLDAAGQLLEAAELVSALQAASGALQHTVLETLATLIDVKSRLAVAELEGIADVTSGAEA